MILLLAFQSPSSFDNRINPLQCEQALSKYNTGLTMQTYQQLSMDNSKINEYEICELWFPMAVRTTLVA